MVKKCKNELRFNHYIQIHLMIKLWKNVKRLYRRKNELMREFLN